jgi:hypothetical protein
MVAALVLLVLPLAQAYRLDRGLASVGVQEDAFIGLRHLRHFVEHGRLVYNLDTSTLGATAPLFWILSGIGYLVLHTLGLVHDLIAYHLGFVWTCWAATLVTFVALARGPGRVAVAALAVAGASLFAFGFRFMYLGLEGPFLTLSLAAIFVLVRARVRLEVVLAVCGVLAWDRPEIGLIAVPALLPPILLHARGARARLRRAGSFLVAWAVPPVLMLVLTGEVIPNTVRAKSYFGASTAALRAHPIDFLAARLRLIERNFVNHHALVPVLIALVLGFATWHAIAAVRTVRAARARGDDPSASPFPWRAALGLFAAGYTAFILLVPTLWDWYQANWAAFALVVAGVMIHDGIERLRARPTWSRRRAVALACAVAVLGAGAYVAARSTYRMTRSAVTIWLTRERDFRGRLGLDLDRRWHARSVWMEAAGWQGYFNDARVYDEVGLTDSEVFRFADRYGCGYFMAAMRALKPQFVVKRRLELRHNAIFTSPRVCPHAPLFLDAAARREFAATYRQVAVYSSEMTDPGGSFSGRDLDVLLFERVEGLDGAPVSPSAARTATP